MKEFLAVVGLVVIAITGVGLLCAYPTMWLVNYLFNPVVLTTVFATGHINIWQAWGLNILCGLLFKSTPNSK